MSRGPCPNPNQEGCPWQERPGGCFSDTDHIVPQRYRSLGLLVKKYIQTPDNQQQICRYEHDQKNLNSHVTESTDQIPAEEFMLDAVARAFRAGMVRLSSHEQQRLFGT